MTLNQLLVGKSAVIRTVGGEGALRQHFLDMGMIPGAEVTVVKLAPMGDPMELQVHGYELTIRMADAAQKTAVTITSATTDSAFAKLDALERKIAEKEATAEAYGAMSGMAASEIIISDEDEFAQLKHEAAVNDQLAALKAELGLD